jgi:hypothetical protein
MAFGSGDHADDRLTPAERERLAAIRAADSLADLVTVTGAASEHDAYVAAKETWADARGKELPTRPETAGFFGTCVEVGAVRFHVHGITHANTPAERAYLHAHVPALLEADAAVTCEQGIRSMYFADLSAVGVMDDYRWAIEQCRALEGDSRLPPGAFDGLAEDVSSVTAEVRRALRALAEAGSEGYGEEVARALGDLTPGFLRSHAELATGEGPESFVLTRQAARDPARLFDLQRYYQRTFLPQPLEREWLRRHDRELELLTHARNARMADGAVYHHDGERAVHLVVGAAHLPGVAYYLRQHRDGERRLDGFEPA